MLQPNAKSLKRERAIFESDTHSPPTTNSDESIIEQFETERQNFSESACPLLPKQIDAFDTWCNLLQESATSLVKRSRQHRSRRLRARTLLANVFLQTRPRSVPIVYSRYDHLKASPNFKFGGRKPHTRKD